MSSVDLSGGRDRRFVSTRWSVVVSAADVSCAEAGASMAVLCELYWYPLYVFIRRRGYGAEAAQDLVQGFFARLLEKRDFGAACPERGRFRTWLLASFEHYASNERDRESAKKRGGGAEIVSLDLPGAEERYARDAGGGESPEKAYARRWVLALLERVLLELEREMAAEGKEALFTRLKPLLTPDGLDMPYRTLAAELGMSESALKVTVHRMRKRYRSLLQQSVASTLEDPACVNEEIAFLLSAVS